MDRGRIIWSEPYWQTFVGAMYLWLLLENLHKDTKAQELQLKALTVIELGVTIVLIMKIVINGIISQVVIKLVITIVAVKLASNI